MADLLCAPVSFEQVEAAVVDDLVGVTRDVSAEGDAGAKTFDAELEVIALDATDGDSRLVENVWLQECDHDKPTERQGQN